MTYITRTDSPTADYNRYMAALEEELAAYPTCQMCGDKATSDYVYLINGKLICESCLISEHRHNVEEYMDEWE